MRRCLPIFAFLLLWTGSVQAHGLLIPEEKSLPPLAMLNHKVTIDIKDQVAVTRVEQTFRNHTQRQLEATYVFPVPKGAGVNKFTMWVNGEEVKGELVEASKARDVYNSIVRRTQDPGLLEYIGTNLLRMRVFPIPPNGDQKVALSYSSVANRESGLVEYVYPLKTDGKATQTLEELTITADINSQHGVSNVYSPTHSITLKRRNDKQVTVTFDKKQGLLDKDFQMFYQLGDKDVGLTALTHRPVSSEKGHFLMLMTPKVEMSKGYEVPRDVVMVLDTSGSMRGPKMEQARKALKYCLDNLTRNDRFALINFATTVNRYKDNLLKVESDQISQAKKWVDELEATGGTAINDALASALDLRDAKEEGRTFTVIFFTDGQPTIGETNVETIMKNTMAKNTTSTRIFTFGVGDDVNATFLDALAEKTRAIATYVRPEEDIEAKTSALYSKISHPVLANLKLATTGDVSLSEVYPAQLPDLFHGQQLTVCGRFTGKGASAIKLTGMVGKETKEIVYEITFPEKTGNERDFVEQLWARRKVGYLLDQIRANGEKKELVDEVVTLAKRYGITTPYTSYLIVPDGVAPVVTAPIKGTKPGGGGGVPKVNFAPAAGASNAPALHQQQGGTTTTAPAKVEAFARMANAQPGQLAQGRFNYTNQQFQDAAKGGYGFGGGAGGFDDRGKQAEAKWNAFNSAQDQLRKRQYSELQAGKLGVDLSLQTYELRNQTRLEMTAQRNIQGRNLMEVGGVWIDEGFCAKTTALVIKAQSNAYFKLLEKRPELKDVLRLGNHLVWVAPSGTALVIDMNDGKTEVEDKDIDALFVVPKK
jgi:Ca-activated chloride channel family protein